MINFSNEVANQLERQRLGSEEDDKVVCFYCQNKGTIFVSDGTRSWNEPCINCDAMEARDD